ncbi:hypothetical protein J6TS1_15980 [Siminovitchia terrae]|uniref:Preprotein translocase subunit Tim44 n=1 Tax=Siminovitchia terrae TaxID=1914933 RepID=A0A429X8N5_SIMTE|nr:hypothetical protein [Siminovitchia terrae]RST59749.1 preprotein translocase subunit Tim44 [Siminovitchia terrae]GIN91637.1 hypothetical protein J22TS1_26880 [Siminovitchia terrae]GIN95728.1 hypothetical protein J6TS1_15980 [Siminovitchia terrae]
MKKIITALLTATLLLSPVGNLVFQDHVTTVEAKGYKSGKRSFNMKNNQSNFQQKQKQESPKTNSNKQQTNPKGGFFSGGLMKGLMFGGLAGLLFGSLFANMGAFGSLLGLIVNLAAIYILFVVIRKVFTALTRQRRREDTGPWGR